MKNFYCHVDLRSRKQMTGFLKNHFRYPTMNSWNYSTSYACDLKIHSLGLDADLTDRLYDMLELQEFFSVQKELLYEFGKQHRFLWQACMNGRSGGYLVLYQGEMRESGYQSYCTCCGCIMKNTQVDRLSAVRRLDELRDVWKRQQEYRRQRSTKPLD